MRSLDAHTFHHARPIRRRFELDPTQSDPDLIPRSEFRLSNPAGIYKRPTLGVQVAQMKLPTLAIDHRMGRVNQNTLQHDVALRTPT
jgi:hypothetical protein